MNPRDNNAITALAAAGTLAAVVALIYLAVKSQAVFGQLPFN